MHRSELAAEGLTYKVKRVAASIANAEPKPGRGILGFYYNNIPNRSLKQRCRQPQHGHIGPVSSKALH